MEFKPKEVVTLPYKGEVLLYSAVAEDGAIHDGGMISLDKQWIMPCTLGDYFQSWHIMEPIKGRDNEYRIIYRKSMDMEVDQRLIQLVDFVALEKFLLEEKYE